MDSLKLRKLGIHAARLAAIFLAVAAPLAAHAVSWFPFGPDGGDARSFAADPQDHLHIFLGTINGWIYESHDGGAKWVRLANVGKRDDLALDNIIVDPLNPQHILVGAWVLDHPDGGLFVSNDGGRTWENLQQMRGQSVRSMTESHSDPKTMLAGTLEGVYRSVDSGKHWRLISPAGSRELHEVESVAIDSADPNTLYAGTWHLPWKSTDGGEHWTGLGVPQGIIEDSDVFSIIVDPVKPQDVYLSACSGIYRSVDRGNKFEKVKGIPSSARRTRVLMQDPSHQATVFAGTTEGLFRSDDSGVNWIRTTGPEVIVNDVYIDDKDPRHVLIATDRGGVLSSDDGGDSFHPSNRGFSARQITTFASDPKHPATVYVGVVNDKDWGGVFESTDGGLRWTQQSAGLQGRDVFSLTESHTGTLLAGTGHGIFRLKDSVWTRVDGVPAAKKPAPAKPAAKAVKGHPVARHATKAIPLPAAVKSFDPSVYALASTDLSVIAATTGGLLTSDDDGASWTLVKGTGDEPWRFASAVHHMAVAATLHAISYSTDSGATWKAAKLPEKLTQIGAVAIEDTGELWAGGREGVYVSSDGGASWSVPENLFVSGVNSIYYDAQTKRVLLTALGATTMAFTVQMPERKVSFTDTGWKLRFVRPVGDHMVGATLFDGIVVQPQMVASPVSTAQTASR